MRQYVQDHIKNVFEENAQNTPDFMGTRALFHYDIAILRSIAMSTQTVLPVS